MGATPGRYPYPPKVIHTEHGIPPFRKQGGWATIGDRKVNLSLTQAHYRFRIPRDQFDISRVRFDL